MFVMKRDGRKEAVAFDKITARISNLCYGLDPKYVEPVIIAQKVSILVVFLLLLFLFHFVVPSPPPCFGGVKGGVIMPGGENRYRYMLRRPRGSYVVYQVRSLEMAPPGKSVRSCHLHAREYAQGAKVRLKSFF